MKAQLIAVEHPFGTIKARMDAAFAPLFLVWFGLGPVPIVVATFLVAFSPMVCERHGGAVPVSGLGIFKAPSTPGAKRYSPANTKRSMLLKATRFGALRRSTLSWCRRTRISASSRALDRNSLVSAHASN
jgi:hypothetical protein